jgi:hypothetical protein
MHTQIQLYDAEIEIKMKMMFMKATVEFRTF